MQLFINQAVSLQESVFNQIVEMVISGKTNAEIMRFFGQKIEPTQQNIVNYAHTIGSVSNASSATSNRYVAFVTAAGVMQRFGSWYNYGYEDIARQIKAADANPENIGIVLKVHSPGGTSDGNSVVSDAVASCKKPIVGHTSFAMSAGYMMMAPCDEIIIDSGAASQVGSIGSQYFHLDQSEYFQKQGMKPEIIRAKGSEKKNMVNSVEPLTEEARAKIQQVVDACRKEFVGYVQRSRAGKGLKNEALTGEEFSAKEALSLGLVDAVGSIDLAVQRVVQLAKI